MIAVVVSVPGFLSMGCGGPAVDQSLPLVMTAYNAEVTCEQASVDFGTVEAHSQLVAGWSGDERTKDGRTFVWGVGESSTLELFLARSRELGLRLTARPFSFPNAPTQTVEVVFNGELVESLSMRRGFGEYTVRVPAAMVRPGYNKVELKYGYAYRVGDVIESADRRRLAVAWDEFQIDETPGSTRQVFKLADSAYSVAPGCELAFYFSENNWKALEMERDEGIRTIWQGEGRQEEVIGDGPHRAHEWVELPDSTGMWKLSLRNPGDGQSKPLRVRASLHGTAGHPGGQKSANRAAVETQSRPNVVLYLVDTLRSDRLGCYGGPKELTPNLNRFAASGWLFSDVVAQSSWTKPSVASILTGLSPLLHGVSHVEHVLPSAATTVAERLKDIGYETAAFSANAYVTAEQGFGQGFDEFHYTSSKDHEVVDLVDRWLSKQPKDQPFFLYVHVIDPHAPYDPDEQFADSVAPGIRDPSVGSIESRQAIASGQRRVTESVIADLKALYDAEVAQADDAFGRMMSALDSKSLSDRTWILFLSDHGEEFFEHGGMGHGTKLYRELLSVPLIVRPPGGIEAHRVGVLVQHLDVMPTILDVVGLETKGMEGRSLLKIVSEDLQPTVVTSYVENDGREGLSVTTQRWKLVLPIANWTFPSTQLFDRHLDPQEFENRSVDRPVVRGVLSAIGRRELQRRASALTADTRPIDEETARQLRALGYLN